MLRAVCKSDEVAPDELKQFLLDDGVEEVACAGIRVRDDHFQGWARVTAPLRLNCLPFKEHETSPAFMLEVQLEASSALSPMVPHPAYAGCVPPQPIVACMTPSASGCWAGQSPPSTVGSCPPAPPGVQPSGWWQGRPPPAHQATYQPPHPPVSPPQGMLSFWHVEGDSVSASQPALRRDESSALASSDAREPSASNSSCASDGDAACPPAGGWSGGVSAAGPERSLTRARTDSSASESLLPSGLHREMSNVLAPPPPPPPPPPDTTPLASQRADSFMYPGAAAHVDRVDLALLHAAPLVWKTVSSRVMTAVIAPLLSNDSLPDTRLCVLEPYLITMSEPAVPLIMTPPCAQNPDERAPWKIAPLDQQQLDFKSEVKALWDMLGRAQRQVGVRFDVASSVTYCPPERRGALSRLLHLASHHIYVSPFHAPARHPPHTLSAPAPHASPIR